MHDGERAFLVYVVFFHSFAQTDERECVFFPCKRVSAELYDQILELCFYRHTAFPAFFPFILCTTKMTDFLTRLFFHQSSLTTIAKPTSAMIVAYPRSGQWTTVTLLVRLIIKVAYKLKETRKCPTFGRSA